MPVDKFGSSGEHKPRVWATRSCFANQGDVRGFSDLRSPGIYALELTRVGGPFRPAAIEGRGDEPEWEIKLALAMQYLDLQSPTEGGIQKVVWLMNAGSMFVGYRPSGAEPMTLNGSVNEYYLGPKITNTAKLQAFTTFPADLEIIKKPPQGSTIFLKLELGAMTPTAPVEVFPGVSLKWKRPETVGLVIRNKAGVMDLTASIADLETSIAAEKVSLEFIYSGSNFWFKRLLFSLSQVSDRYIEQLSDDNNNTL